ncbi:MAG: LysR family transcriptional regulator [Bdellovibrionota bacterium]
MSKFLLTDSESELLLKFEESPSLESLAANVGRDITVISRQLKRISEKADVLTKISGRWCITKIGKRFNEATLDFLRIQKSIFSEKYILRIGTNREFASRVISRNINSLQNRYKNATLEIRSYERGAELALLSGEIDIAFDCGRPQSPEIKYTQIQNEIIIAVASPAFKKKHGNKEELTDLSKLPHIHCERLRPDRVVGMNWDSGNIVIHTNDIATAREMALQSIGWALLPEYAIRSELKSNLLKPLLNKTFDQEKYGVWFMRSRVHLEKDFKNACEWLKNVNF